MLSRDLQDKLRHNTIMNLLDGGFFGFAVIGLASYVTIVPLYLSYLTESTALIGFMATLFHIGWQFPQLLTSNYVSGLRRYKPMALAMTLMERFPYFGLALVAFLIPVIGADSALLLSLFFFAWQSIGGGFTATAWQSMLSKIMPPHRLGAFYGLQAACVNLFGAGGALLASAILARHAFPGGFSIIFLVAALSLLLSFVFLARTYEPESEPKHIAARLPWRDFGGRLREILREDPNFRWFLCARALTSVSLTVVSFFTIYGVRQYEMSPEFASSMTSVLLVSQTLSSTLVGWAGDRWGHRRVLIFGNLATVLSIVVALAAPNVTWFYLVFALTGIVHATQWSSIMTITIQFGSIAERPIYIGLANTLIAPVTILSPIIGGWLIDSVSFDLVFAVFALTGVFAMIVYLLPMQEPKHAKRIRGAYVASD